jgi:hypothetical protein
MRESTRGMNSTVSRLDRDARRIGLPFRQPKGHGCNTREFFSATGGRRWLLKPGGKGVLRIQAFLPADPDLNDGHSWALDAENVVSVERAHDIMCFAKTVGADPEDAR